MDMSCWFSWINIQECIDGPNNRHMSNVLRNQQTSNLKWLYHFAFLLVKFKSFSCFVTFTNTSDQSFKTDMVQLK
jgi:hypothetical protein